MSNSKKEEYIHGKVELYSPCLIVRKSNIIHEKQQGRVKIL